MTEVNSVPQIFVYEVYRLSSPSDIKYIKANTTKEARRKYKEEYQENTDDEVWNESYESFDAYFDAIDLAIEVNTISAISITDELLEDVHSYEAIAVAYGIRVSEVQRLAEELDSNMENMDDDEFNMWCEDIDEEYMESDGAMIEYFLATYNSGRYDGPVGVHSEVLTSDGWVEDNSASDPARVIFFKNYEDAKKEAMEYSQEYGYVRMEPIHAHLVPLADIVIQ